VKEIEIELSDETAEAALAAGLLTPEALRRLLEDAIRRQQAADLLLGIADRVAAAGIEPMSMEEIDAEVKTFRAARRRHRMIDYPCLRVTIIESLARPKDGRGRGPFSPSCSCVDDENQQGPSPTHRYAVGTLSHPSDGRGRSTYGSWR
jgi:hypothetical protein